MPAGYESHEAAQRNTATWLLGSGEMNHVRFICFTCIINTPFPRFLRRRSSVYFEQEFGNCTLLCDN